MYGSPYDSVIYGSHATFMYCNPYDNDRYGNDMTFMYGSNIGPYDNDARQ